MGLFGKKKPKNKKDFDILSGDGLVSFVAANLKNPTPKNILKGVQAIARPDDDLDHLTPEGDLPWGWHTANKAFTQKIESEYKYFLNKWLDTKDRPDIDQYIALRVFVMYMHDVKVLCKEKGECFVYWRDCLFDDKYLSQQAALLHQLEKRIKKQ